MKRLVLLISFAVLGYSFPLKAQRHHKAPVKPACEPVLERIYFNLYADSIKPVLNYYVNVEGLYKGGAVLPLDTSSIILTCDHGAMSGNEWVVPKVIGFDKVTFKAVAKGKPELQAVITVYMKKWKDPRDEMKRDDMDMPVVHPKRR